MSWIVPELWADRRPSIAVVFVVAMERVATLGLCTRAGDASRVLVVQGNCMRATQPGRVIASYLLL